MAEQRHKQTEAIILKSCLTGEINRYFQFISPEMGIQSATAFGAAKIKSRFCSSVQPFVKARLFLYSNPKNNYLKLEDISDISSNDFIRKDLDLMYLFSFFGDVFMNCYISEDEYKNYYYLLLYTIDILEKYNDLHKALLFFTSKFFFLSGYTFNLTCCKNCSSKSEKYFFDFKEGGIFCEHESVSKRFPVSCSAIDLWSDFLEKRFVQLKDVKINKDHFNELYPIIIHLTDSIFEKKLKTLKNINDVFMK